MIYLFLLALSVALAFGVFMGGKAMILRLADNSKDLKWSPFRRKPEGGLFLIILKGGVGGAFDRIVHALPEHRYDKHGSRRFEPLKRGEIPSLPYLEETLGVVWVGFFKGIYSRDIKYNVPTRGKDGQWIIEERKRKTQEGIFFQHTMAIRMVLLAKNNLPVEIVVVPTVEIRDPIRAELTVGAWERRITADIEEICREYVGSKALEKLREEVNESGSSKELGDNIVGISITEVGDDGKVIKVGSIDRVGVAVVDARLIVVKVAEPSILEATLKQETARLDKLAAVDEAKARKIRGVGDKEYYEALLSALNSHPMGHHIRRSEALEKASGLRAYSEGGGDQKVVVADVSEKK